MNIDHLTQAAVALVTAEPFSGGATHEQYVEVAERFGVELHALEGVYLDLVDALSAA